MLRQNQQSTTTQRVAHESDNATTKRRERVQEDDDEFAAPEWTYKCFDGITYSKAGLWRRSDENGNVWWECQEMWSTWTNQVMWDGDADYPLNRTPMEAWIMNQFCNQESILQIHNSHVHDDKMMYRILTEYFPYATLHELLNSTYNAGKRVPGPPLWHILDMLIDGCTLLEQGDLARPKKNWRLIAHRDI